MKDHQVQQATEDALSHIFVHNERLNPESVTDIVAHFSPECSSAEVLSYMHNQYGWNDTFTFEPDTSLHTS